MWDYFLHYPIEFAFGWRRVPAASLLIALVVAAVVLYARSRRPGSAGSGEVAPGGVEHRTIGFAALAVLAAYVVEYVVRGYLLNLRDVVEWWQYATPVAAATLALAAVRLAIGRRAPVETPAVPTLRRTWRSFSTTGGLVGTGAAIVALLVVTVAAGSASSADGDGRFIHLELNAPNTDLEPQLPWFYGWAFGVPVLVCLVALVTMTWLTLHANAARPFRRPGSVLPETAARRATASGVVRLASGGALLALAGALRFIDRSGSIETVTYGDTGRSYEIAWRWAEFATAGGWLAPVLDIAAFVSLLLLAVRLVGAPGRNSELEDARAERAR